MYLNNLKLVWLSVFIVRQLSKVVPPLHISNFIMQIAVQGIKHSSLLLVKNGVSL